jgi:hypothetical protein
MTDAAGTSWAWRLAGWAGWVLVVGALAALGWLWHVDRARVWETPSLGPPLVLLRATPGRPDAITWLVAVNPECSHCRKVLAQLAGRPMTGVRVGALIVDTSRQPAPSTLSGLPGGPIWWDARNDWRRRWGHRTYGEVIRFDSRGRYLSTRVQLPTP